MSTLWAARMSHRLLVSTLLIVTAWAQQTQSPTANEPTGSFEELSTKAAAARDAGKSNDAIQLYRAALNLHSDWAEGWWYLGTLNYDADRYAAHEETNG